MPSWSPGQYLRFEDERSRPAQELLARVPLKDAKRIVDLGCGPGNSTSLVVERFPDAEVVGLDTSPEMLTVARRRLPTVTFAVADAADWSPPRPVDLIFANAVFHWVPDHLSVLARLMTTLTPGGVLAIQVPDNHHEPTHEAMRAVARTGPWRGRFATPIVRETILEVATYYDRLRPLSDRIDIWRTIYHHPLDEVAAIVEWVKGTGLGPFLDRLSDDQRDDFLVAYKAKLEATHPPLVDGKVLLRFPRLFVVARRH